MDYISGDNTKADLQNEAYYRRFNYPMNSGSDVGYKCNTLSIVKFEKNHQSGFFNNSPSLEYQFINAFPKGMTSIPVQYGGAEILQVNVQFAYDRYIVK